MRFLCRSSFASSRLMPSGAVIEVRGHHVAHGLVEVRLEAHVAVGEDADRLAVALDHGQALISCSRISSSASSKRSDPDRW